jgi:hypothetical protein
MIGLMKKTKIIIIILKRMKKDKIKKKENIRSKNRLLNR